LGVNKDSGLSIKVVFIPSRFEIAIFMAKISASKLDALISTG